MAHYAYLDENNVVVNVVVGRDDPIEGVDWEEYYGAVKTSYNTHGNVHFDPYTKLPSSDQSKAFRKNYAAIGYTYDSERDAFIPPKPFNSWVINEETCYWEAPIPAPEDGFYYSWDEESMSWNRDTVS